MLESQQTANQAMVDLVVVLFQLITVVVAKGGGSKQEPDLERWGGRKRERKREQPFEHWPLRSLTYFCLEGAISSHEDINNCTQIVCVPVCISVSVHLQGCITCRGDGVTIRQPIVFMLFF